MEEKIIKTLTALGVPQRNLRMKVELNYGQQDITFKVGHYHGVGRGWSSRYRLYDPHEQITTVSEKDTSTRTVTSAIRELRYNGEQPAAIIYDVDTALNGGTCGILLYLPSPSF